MPTKPAPRKVHTTPEAAVAYAIDRGLYVTFARALPRVAQSQPSATWVQATITRLLKAHSSVVKERFLPSLLALLPEMTDRLGERFIDEALQHGADDCIPLLVDAGAVFPEGNMAYSMLVAKALGEGRWPHPDRIFPDVLDHPLTAQEVARGVFGPPPPRKRGALNYFHMEKLLSLPASGVATHAFSTELARSFDQFNSWFRLTENPEAKQAISQMITAGLISASLTLAQLSQNSKTLNANLGELLSDLSHAALSEFSHADLSASATPTTRRSSPRL